MGPDFTCDRCGHELVEFGENEWICPASPNCTAVLRFARCVAVLRARCHRGSGHTSRHYNPIDGEWDLETKAADQEEG
jgi:hypothetical protein